MLKRFVFYLSLFNTLLLISRTQLIKEGPCKNIPPQENFDRDRIGGIWYLQARSPRSEEGGENVKCTKLNDDIKENDTNEFTRWWIDTSKNAKYVYKGVGKFDKSGRGVTPDGVNFVVFETDYDMYQVRYGCKALDNSKREDYVWVYYRTQECSHKYNDLSINAMNKYGIGYPEIFDIQQKDCPTDWSDSIKKE